MYRCLLCSAPIYIRQVQIQEEQAAEEVAQGKRKRKRKSRNNSPPICCDVCGSRIAEKVERIEESRTIQAI